MEVVDSIRRLLLSTKVKDKRDGLKQLDVQLDSALFLHQLDAATAKLWPQDKLTYGTWPGLLDMFLNFLSREVLDAGKQLDSNGLKVLRRVFALADDADRCGPGSRNLLRRAGVAFDRIHKVLESAQPPGEGLATPLGRELVTILLKVLLPNAEYCQRSTVAVFQGLLEEVMCRFESLQHIIDTAAEEAAARSAAAVASGRLAHAAGGVLGRGKEVLQAENDMYSMASLLAGLLNGVPGQLAGQFVMDTASFLVEGVKWLGQRRRFGKLDVQLLSCLNGLMLAYGADLRPAMATLHRPLQDYIKHAWGERNTRLKECVLCYCRLALTLGGMNARCQSEILTTKDITADNLSWDLQGNKQHQLLAALTASLYYHQAFTPAGSSSSSHTHSSSTSAASGATATAAAGHMAGSQGSSGSPAHNDATAAAVGTVRRRSRSAQAAEGDQTDHQAAAAAEVELGAAAAGSDGDDGDELEVLPRKRTKVSSYDENLLLKVQLWPDKWCPVLSLLLHQHGPLLPHSFTTAALKQLSGSISCTANSLAAAAAAAATNTAAAVGTASLPSGGVLRRSASPAVGATAAAVAGVAGTAGARVQQQQQQLMWLLRCSCELAVCWPAELHRLATAAAAAAAVGADGANGLHSSYATSDQNSAAQSTADIANSCSTAWQRIWDSLAGLVTTADMHLLDSFPAATVDAIAWQMHVLVALKLVDVLPSRATALLHLLPLLAPQRPAVPDHDKGRARQAHLPMTDAQLALIITLCSGERIGSQSEVAVRQQLLDACLATAEMHCSSSRGIQHRPSAAGAAAAAATAGVSGAAACLPELLLPAIVMLLEAPGLPTPGMNGCESGLGLSNKCYNTLNPNAASAPGFSTHHQTLNPDACHVVWYHASSWWWADRRVEGLIEGLELGFCLLRRRQAALQLQQLLAAADDQYGISSAAYPAGSSAIEEDVQWKCWCRLADNTAEALTQAISDALPEEENDQQDAWAAQQQQDTAGTGHTPNPTQQLDPNRQISHLLLLANVAANVPCIAVTKCLHIPQCMMQQRDEPGLQQHQQQWGSWCGVGFSGVAGLHEQLQQQMLQVVDHVGYLLREHMPELPCAAGSTWLQQLQHLGTSLARLQRMLNTIPPTPAAPTEPQQQQQGQQPASSMDVAVAVAKGIVQPIVLKLEDVLKAAAAAAVVAPDDPRYRRSRAAAAGDLDLDDDFAPAIAAPAFSGGPTASGITQSGFGFSTQPTMGPPASRTAAAAAGTAAGAAAGPGYVVLLSGVLAGCGGASHSALGSRAVAPVLAGFEASLNPMAVSSGVRHSFELGGLGEGLTGVSGAEGAGLRALAAISPARGPDVAQGLLQLWRTVSGTGGGAPSEVLLEALVETMSVAVCSGGWGQLGQLFGLVRGSHTLLAAQKPPPSTLHLVLRLLQAVAVSASAAGLQLDSVRAAFMAAVSQGPIDVEDGEQGSLLDEMMEIFKDVHGRLSKLRKAAEHAAGHNPLPQSTQLQLGLTILALLQLHPQYAYGSSAATAAMDVDGDGVAAELQQYRAEMLELLDTSSYTLRIRAGPLAAQLIADAAAASLTSAVADEPRRSSSVLAAFSAAVADIQRRLILQRCTQLDQQQLELMQLMQKHPANVSPEDAARKHGVARQLKLLLLCWETVAVQITDLAAVAAAVAAAAVRQEESTSLYDAQLLHLLLNHAACVQQLPSEVLPGLHSYEADCRSAVLQTVTAAVDVMAVQQQYSRRYSYLTYHAPTWMWQWFLKGCTFEQMLLLHPILCPGSSSSTDADQQALAAPAAALKVESGNASSKAAAQQLLDCYGSSIFISTLHTDADQELHAVAEAIGVGVEVLCNRYRWVVFATLYPRTVRKGNVLNQANAIAEKVGQRSSQGISSGDKLALMNQLLNMALPVVSRSSTPQAQQQKEQFEVARWFEQAEQRDANTVFYPQHLALEASNIFCKNVAGSKEQGTWVDRMRLSKAALQQMLLNMHRNIAAAAHPVHKLQRLAQFEAPLHLLHAHEVSAPAIARYYVSMLLQLVHVPELQPTCCFLLELLYQLLYKAAAAAADGAAPVAKGASKEEKAAAKVTQQRQQQQQQLATALLEEVLPPTVANLIQCVEHAAATQQLQQQQLIWGSSGTLALQGLTAAVASVPIDLPGSNPAVGLLLALLRNPPQGLLPVIQTLDLLPSLPVLSEPVALQSRLQQGLKLTQRIIQFADRAAGMAISSRHRLIQAITVQLRHNAAELYVTGAVHQQAQSSIRGGASSSSRSRSSTPDHSAKFPLKQDATVTAAALYQHQEDGEQHQQCVQPSVVAAAFKLAKLGAQLDDTEVTELAGHLLALSGPLDPNIITIDAATAAGTADSSSSDSGCSKGSLKDRAAFPMRDVLQHLAGCLFHYQPCVVAVAQDTLAQLLTTNEAAAEVNVLLQAVQGKGASSDTRIVSRSLLLASYLSCFTPSPETSHSSSQPTSRISADREAAVRALARATTAELWSPIGKTFDSWLCTLCSTLLTACGAAGAADNIAAVNATAGLLQLLAGAAELQPQLAELLLPHALLALCESDGSGADVPGIACMGLSARLGDCIAEGMQLSSSSSGSRNTASAYSIFSNNNSSSNNDAGMVTKDTVDVRCLSVLLACLEHNRIVHRAALLTLPGTSLPPPAVTWQRCYCLHINYLDVAAAAMACKAYFTALIYIEHWCEEQYGRLGLNPAADQGSAAAMQLQQLHQLAGMSSSSSTGAGVGGGTGRAHQQQQELVEQLLLELYNNVNEPDGIYAVAAAFSSTASQLHLLRHEQQWASVLGAEDALLQGTAVATDQYGQWNSSGVLTALQHLGCQSTAQQCLAAAITPETQSRNTRAATLYSSSAQVQHQQLLDAQCELAWRLSDWGIANSTHMLSGSGSNCTGLTATLKAADNADNAILPSFNAAVLSALHALQSKDAETFTSCVAHSRHTCIVQIARSSTQSAAAVNPLLVQLRMLHMLQQGLEFSRSEAAAAATTRSLNGGTVDAITDDSAERLLQRIVGADFACNGGSTAAEQLRDVRFELSDQLLALQAAITKVLQRPDALALTLQAHAHTARKAGQVNFALAALNQLQRLLKQKCTAHARSAAEIVAVQPGGTAVQRSKLPGWLSRMIAPDAPWLLEAVKLKWRQGQQLPAFRELQALLSALQMQYKQQQTTSGAPTTANANLAAALMRAQALAGQWMAAGQFSSGADDAMALFKEAAAIAHHQQQQEASGAAAADMSRLHCRVYFQLASYADQRFKEIEVQMASPEWQKQIEVLRSKQQSYNDIIIALKALQKRQQTNEVKLEMRKLNSRGLGIQRQIETDGVIVQQMELHREACLRTAMSSYRNCIITGNTHDLQVVYRLCSIWFKLSNDVSVNGTLGDVFASTPSAKFVPLVYQIASRLESSDTEFQAVLKTALNKLARDHPYHTLYSLIALKNGNLGSDGTNQLQTEMGKVQAAAALLSGLKAAGPDSLATIIDHMVAQVDVYIAITGQKVPRDAKGKITVAQCALESRLRRQMLGLTAAPPITANIPLDPTCRYEDVPHVVEVDSMIEFVGGINAPMVFRTTDSSGHSHKQLAKSGGDDLRQDAVMQQFFGLVNALLSNSAASVQRQLSLRTYRVVPCSPKVGVVQWVEGTQPMMDYLCSGPRREHGACARYRKPGNLSWLDCYMKLHGSKPEELKDCYLYCTAHFPPVFHNFFLECFPQPAKWFTARTAYTRSTAVNSMAGAIIGLGDRHLNNILLDVTTAEVLHIDLGIAFEQGLFLNTPERVPFRLTANVVDGMGAAGTEGTFRRCCETTLETLRSHKEALLTVVEVVLHDPLYKWQMTPVKAQRKQQDPLEAGQDGAAGGGGAVESTTAYGITSGNVSSSNGIGNADAERAVLRVKQKLEGQDVEGGVALSVGAQVGKWLQDAQDPDRLCRMFVGWSAWL